MGRRRISSEKFSNRQSRGFEDLQILLGAFGRAGRRGGPRGESQIEKTLRRMLGSQFRLQEQFTPAFTEQAQRFNEQAIANDPRLSILSEGTQGGLSEIFRGLSGPGAGDAFGQGAINQFRSIAQARGLDINNPGAALQETLGFQQFREGVRDLRLRQAAPFISAGLGLSQGVVNPVPGALGSVLPSGGQLLQGQLQSRQLGLQADIANQELGLQADAARGQLFGNIVGLAGTIGGAAIGGPIGAGIGSFFGNQVGSAIGGGGGGSSSFQGPGSFGQSGGQFFTGSF
jgi:hypothetical protein